MTKPSSVSHEQRVAWGRIGGLAGAANQTPVQRYLSSKKANAARAATYSHEELSQRYAGCLSRRLARMPPDEAAEFQRNAGRKRWLGSTPKERSRLARKAIQTRHARIAYAKNPGPVDELLAFLKTFIATNGYSPSMRAIEKAMHHNLTTTGNLLRMLEAMGRIERPTWRRAITIKGNEPTIAQPSEGEPKRVQVLAIAVPRSTRKCYDCDEPALGGKKRCEKHLAKVREACNRNRKAHHTRYTLTGGFMRVIYWQPTADDLRLMQELKAKLKLKSEDDVIRLGLRKLAEAGVSAPLVK